MKKYTIIYSVSVGPRNMNTTSVQMLRITTADITQWFSTFENKDYTNFILEGWPLMEGEKITLTVHQAIEWLKQQPIDSEFSYGNSEKKERCLFTQIVRDIYNKPLLLVCKHGNILKEEEKVANKENFIGKIEFHDEFWNMLPNYIFKSVTQSRAIEILGQIWKNSLLCE